jgi:hypothetical protein
MVASMATRHPVEMADLMAMADRMAMTDHTATVGSTTEAMTIDANQPRTIREQ